MAKYAKKDAGLEYVLSLGFSPARSNGGLRNKLVTDLGAQAANEFLRIIDERTEGKVDAGFYAQKNRTYELGLAVTGAFDADYIRKACNWVTENEALFGKTILEIGCDCGVMSCFLAKRFPDARITAIDRCPEGIANAKRLAEKLGVPNVEFICCEPQALTERFDTVLSMRTVQENLAEYEKEDLVTDFYVQSDIFKTALSGYARSVAARLTPDGTLISAERLNRDAMMSAWVELLYEDGAILSVDAYEEMVCNVLGQDTPFQIMVFRNGQAPEMDEKELFATACSKYINMSLPAYRGWDAKLLYDIKKGELVKGVIVDNPGKNIHSKVAVHIHKFDETCLVCYQNNNGNAVTFFADVSEKETYVKGIESLVKDGMVFPETMVTELA